MTSALSFEDTIVGEASVFQEIDVLGIGDTTIHLDAASLTGPNADQFTIDDGCAGRAIALEDECKIRVWFTPTATTAKQATVVLPNDAVDGDRETDLDGYALSELTRLPSALILDARDHDPVSGVDQYYDPAALTAFGGDRSIETRFDGWSIRIQAPTADGVLHTGTYTDVDLLGSTETKLGLRVSRNGSGCGPGPGQITGTVTILQTPVLDTDGRVLQFAADFEQHCVTMPGTLRGWIRFHSDIAAPKWTAPKFDLRISESTAKVGDTITITPVVSGIDFFEVRRCRMGIWRPFGDPRGVARMQVASDDCAPWTFTLPESELGAYHVDGRLEFGDSPGIAQQTITTQTDGIEVVGGGQAVPFVTNYPVQSWSPTDYATDQTPTYGSPQTIKPPPGADGCGSSLANSSRVDGPSRPLVVVLGHSRSPRPPTTVTGSSYPTAGGERSGGAGHRTGPRRSQRSGSSDHVGARCIEKEPGRWSAAGAPTRATSRWYSPAHRVGPSTTSTK